MKIIEQLHLTATQRKYITLAFTSHKEHLLAGGWVKINRFTIYQDKITKNERDDYGRSRVDVSRFEVAGA